MGVTINIREQKLKEEIEAWKSAVDVVTSTEDKVNLSQHVADLYKELKEVQNEQSNLDTR